MVGLIARLSLCWAALLLGTAALPAAGAEVSRAGLSAAAESGNLALLKQLLAKGSPVDGRDARGRTALLAATQADQVEAARLLIAAGADVNAKDDIQDSPYLYAAAEGRLAILRLTLAAGADLKSLNRYGGTGLIPACHHGHVDVVRALLQTAVAVDHVNSLGWTALLETVILGDGSARYVEIASLLLAHGASVQLPDREGVTPLEHAQRRGHAAMASLLRAAAANGGSARS